MARWLSSALPGEAVRALVNTAVLAAAMSTLDGLLVAISASVTGDLLGGRGGARANAALLAALAVVTIALAASPPKLVLLFGQVGVYGLVAAGAGPLLAGLWLPGRLPAGPAFASALLALATHLLASAWWTNPGLSAVAALAVGLPIAFLPALSQRPSALALRGDLHARHQ
jgi:SSS family solute:Na+ symporter/sodium/pantothenate symporter